LKGPCIEDSQEVEYAFSWKIQYFWTNDR